MSYVNPSVSTQLNTLTQPEFTNLVRTAWMDPASRITPKARPMYHLDPVGMNNGTERLYAEYDNETFAKRKPEGQNVSKARVGVGYQKLAKLKRFGLEVDITLEMRQFNKYPDVVAALTSLRDFGTQRQELDLTHRFTFSGATSYVNMDGETVDVSTGDGLSLINSAHTLSNSSITYSNVVSGNPVFSSTSLEAAQLLGASAIYSNFGEKRVFTWDWLVTTDYPTVTNEVARQLQSTAQVSASNAAVVNVYKALYAPVVLPYLATTATGAYDANKKNYWFLVSRNWSGYLAEWEPENLVTPADGNNLVDRHADVWTYGVRIGYDIVVVSGRGIIGSLNAS